MRLTRLSALTLFALCVAACGRETSSSGEQSAPAVAPQTSTPDAEKHYTQADYQTACFPYPTTQEIQQFKQIAGVSDQGAIDYQYKQWAQRYPGPMGFCEQKKENEQQQRSQRSAPQQGGWIENAHANDMSHYGDALPHGNN